MRNTTHSPFLLVGGGVLATLIIVFLLRVAVQPHPNHIHYHADMAVFIDGKQVDFSGPKFMEDVSNCAANPEEMTARQRVHLHEQNGSSVHVHASGVTWSHFFSNLGWNITPQVVVTDTNTLYTNKPVRFLLNGSEVRTPMNDTIGDEDQLVISIGDAPVSEVQQWARSLERGAHEANGSSDPASCGSSGHAELTFKERAVRALWF
jgi:hypothetical protein